MIGDFSAGSPLADFWVLESPTNNILETVFYSIVPTKNIKDCFTIPDADGDGKLEFIIKEVTIPDARAHPFISETTADNTYEVI